MKTTVPAKEVQICDVCRREVPYLQKCKFCENEYCLSCSALIAGCVHTVDVCKKCETNETLLKIVTKHSPLIRGALTARDNEIIRVGKREKMKP
jgi:hypothetical protein